MNCSNRSTTSHSCRRLWIRRSSISRSTTWI